MPGTNARRWAAEPPLTVFQPMPSPTSRHEAWASPSPGVSARSRDSGDDDRNEESRMRRCLRGQVGTIRSCLGLVIVAWLMAASSGRAAFETFTIAVIPDTQNYVDYRQQKAQGFPLDSRELFFEQ